MATIDIGSAAIDRALTESGGFTFIELENPANATGTITSFEVWFQANATGLKLGTFYGAGTDYTNRDVEVIGNVTAGSKQTFSGKDCDVTTGDYLGWFFDINGGRMEGDVSGDGVYNKANDQFGAGEQTYTLVANRTYSAYGTGETAVTFIPKIMMF